MKVIIAFLNNTVLPISAFSGVLIAVIIYSIYNLVNLQPPQNMKSFKNKEVLFSFEDWKKFYKKISICNLVVSIVILGIYITLFLTLKPLTLFLLLFSLFVIYIVYLIVIEVFIRKKFKILNEEAKKNQKQEIEQKYDIFDEMK